MSREERFFNPKSLVRIATSVQWEPDLVLYHDGSTNQGRFMEAIAILYRNWLLDEQLPDAVATAVDVGSEDWASAFQRVVEEIPAKLAQVVGFWKGIFSSRHAKSLFGPLIGPEDIGNQPVLLSSIEDRIYRACDQLLIQVAEILREVPYGKN